MTVSIQNSSSLFLFFFFLMLLRLGIMSFGLGLLLLTHIVCFSIPPEILFAISLFRSFAKLQNTLERG